MKTSDLIGMGTPGGPRVPRAWQALQRSLLRMRARLVGGQSIHLAEARQPLEPHSLSEADSATDELDHDLALAMVAQERGLLGEIEDALRRMEKGTYGRCEHTGLPIGLDRLRAMPWTRYGLEAERGIEAAGGLRRVSLGELRSVMGPADGIPGEEEEPATPGDLIPDPRPHPRGESP
ncbi:MAG: TraR/DksA family transcriptional regulator [Verrucomicrobiota bacterium]